MYLLRRTRRDRRRRPSRVFLDQPYPEQLPCVPAGLPCNRGFSLDEEYLACLLGCVHAGSADPSKMRRQKIARMLARKPELGRRVMASRQESLFGPPVFTPEINRVRSVVVKLARGHAAFELAACRLEEPSHCTFVPFPVMTEGQRTSFERVPSIKPSNGCAATG